MPEPLERSCLSLGTPSVPRVYQQRVPLQSQASHLPLWCSVEKIPHSRNSEAVLWCCFLNGLKCFSESFNVSGNLSCIP